MSTWSGIRNKLESDYLCPALRGHIQYFATSYSKSADHEGRAKAVPAAPADIPAPVSYTHLDVYKRQHQGVPAGAGRKISSVAGNHLSRKNHRGAVSYTHLRKRWTRRSAASMISRRSLTRTTARSKRWRGNVLRQPWPTFWSGLASPLTPRRPSGNGTGEPYGRKRTGPL